MVKFAMVICPEVGKDIFMKLSGYTEDEYKELVKNGLIIEDEEVIRNVCSH